MHQLLLILCYFLGIVVASKAKYAVWSVGTKENAIALTFDDGPHQILTPRLLDILKEKKVHVTFFVMGVKVKIHPDIVQRAHNEGHEIANHAYDHPVLARLNFTMISSQMKITSDLIYNATSVVPKVMRPPYGNTNPRVNEHIVKADNLVPIIWSLDTLDWRRPNPNLIVEKVKSRIKPGDIILCHDIHPGTIDAMGPLIDTLHEKGFKFLTVSALMALANPKRRNLRRS